MPLVKKYKSGAWEVVSTGSPGSQGIQGAQGTQGATGAPGADGVGVPAGGATGQVLAKLSNTNYDTGWTSAPGGNADFLSPLLLAEISITGAVTATIGRMHVCSGTTTDYTVTLPAASGNAGKLIGFRMSSALTKLVTIDGNASELIDGEQVRVMWANESAILLCTGTGWTKIAGKSIPSYCHAGSSTDQANISTAGYTKAGLDGVLSQSGCFVLDVANNRITVKRPCRLYIKGRIAYISATPSNDAYYAGIYKNDVFLSSDARIIASTIASMPSVDATEVNADINDYFDLRAFTTDANCSVDGNSNNLATYLILSENISW